jgi:hypothetical protein
MITSTEYHTYFLPETSLTNDKQLILILRRYQGE